MNVVIRTSLLALIATAVALMAAERPRLVVLTDISNEPDDSMSVVRLLCYANEFDLEALIATTSRHLTNTVRPDEIHRHIDAYGQVLGTLSQHASGFPSTSFLHSLVKSGPALYGMDGVGSNRDSEGSNHLISVVDRSDSRPVYVTVWGGPNVLAQALYRVRANRTASQLAAFIAKMRVYTISDQDDSGEWIRSNFPDLTYIVTPGTNYGASTWCGISGDHFYGFSGPDFNLVSNGWVDTHVQHNHGPLGATYPDIPYIMEGDTPSWFYVLPFGPGDPEHPNWGGWGGRYENYGRGLWSDTEDRVRGVDGNWYQNNEATVWRWRQHYQNDFEARMDWNVRSYSQANHPPSVAVAGSLRRTVSAGQNVDLDASGSSDPDGNALSYSWWLYAEPSRWTSGLNIANAGTSRASFTAPSVTQQTDLHIMLEVTDNGAPRLTRYARVIVTVTPNGNPPPPPATGTIGIDLAGNGATVDGVAFRSHSAALSQGFTASNVTLWGGSTPPTLSPSSDSQTALLLQSAVYRPNPANGVGMQLAQAVSNGSYDVTFYVLENHQSFYRDMDLRLEGQTVATAVGELPLWTWAKYGPYRVNVGDGSLSVDVLRRSKGDPHLSGLLIVPVGTTPPPANQAPSVALTSPADGASFSVGSAIGISANASDSDGSVVSVEFFTSGVSLGTDTNGGDGWSVTWNGAAAGSYSLTARATDNAGAATTSSARSITVTTTPPPPPPGGSGSAWEFNTAGNAEGWANQNDVRNIVISGGSFNANTISGFGELVGPTISQSGAVKTVSMRLQNSSPATTASLFFTTAADGAWNSAKSKVIAITPNSGFADYTFDMSAISGWTGTITRLRLDPIEATGTFAIDWIRIGSGGTTPPPGNVAPSVALTNPANGASFAAGAAIAITASASDSDGSVTKVEFLANGGVVGTDTNGGDGWGVVWNGAATGGHTLAARATDDAGAVTTSSTRSITVTSTPGGSGAVWEFNTAGNAEGWANQNDVRNIVISGGSFNANTISGHGELIGPTISQDAAVKTVTMRLQNGSPSTTARLYFITSADGGWNSAKSKEVAIQPNSGYIEYTFDLSGVAGWTGTITRLRLDPIEATGTFSIDYIRIGQAIPSGNG